jgi:urease accessory protein
LFIDPDRKGNVNAGPSPSDATGGWEARLELQFAPGHGKTVIARRRHFGPLLVQRPFYPEGPVCHAYLLHPPGGVVGGDTLTIDIEATGDCAALVTTPAAGKFYRSDGKVARQSVSLRITEGAALEWLPQETIYYQGARVKSQLTIDLQHGARFIGWDVVTLGRPAAGEGFDAGEVELNLRIRNASRPCLLERTVLNPEAFKAPWGLGGHSACGMLIATPTSPAQLETVRGLIGDQPERGVTRIGDVLICRGRDIRADRLRSFFQQVWVHVRQDVIGRRACAPRIWAT